MLPTIELEQQDSLVVATISTSYLTHPEMQELTQMLMQKMRNDRATQFVLDLAAVSYLSSACLGEMVTFLQDLQHVRGRIALANCQPDVLFLFKVTRLDHLFPTFEDLDKAKEHVGG
jgi:anti-anti-sigma factor